VVVYTIPNDKQVYIAYRKPPSTRNKALKKALAEMEKLLTEIIKDAL
jgi:effector-binding domain-containing protein